MLYIFFQASRKQIQVLKVSYRSVPLYSYRFFTSDCLPQAFKERHLLDARSCADNARPLSMGLSTWSMASMGINKKPPIGTNINISLKDQWQFQFCSSVFFGISLFGWIGLPTRSRHIHGLPEKMLTGHRNFLLCWVRHDDKHWSNLQFLQLVRSRILSRNLRTVLFGDRRINNSYYLNKNRVMFSYLIYPYLILSYIIL